MALQNKLNTAITSISFGLALKSFSSKTFYARSLVTEFGRSLVTMHLEVVLGGQCPDMDTIILTRLMSNSGQLQRVVFHLRCWKWD